MEVVKMNVQMAAPQPLNELWVIDCNAMFQNYANLKAHEHNDATSAIGGLVFGRKSKKQAMHVFFAYSEDLIESNMQFILSSLSADIEFIGNVQIDGHSPTLPVDGFTLQLTIPMLENRNVDDFLNLNTMFNNEHILMEGLSLVSKVGYEWAIRAGRESDDIKTACDRLKAASFRFVYINTDKQVVIRFHKEKEKTAKQLDEFSRGAVPYKDVIELKALQSLSRDTSGDTEDQKLVPTVKVTRDDKHYTRLTMITEVVSPAYFGEDSLIIYQRMREAFNRRIQNNLCVTANGIRKGRGILPTTSVTFLPSGWSSLLHLQLPTKWSDNEQKSYRGRLHKIFNLAPNKPCLRLSQSLALHSESVSMTNSKLLRCPHRSIQNYKKVGDLSLVQGPYNYHHYMQDGIDDSGWGCAYRCFQTIWSWLILNGYTDKQVPTHRQIQQCLVDVGDKESKFVGSRQWIGSTEISYVLNSMLDLECRFIATTSGAEVVERARELAQHFTTVGTPVMIGGNMLAHTILGVDFNSDTGDTKFLVLDPHYTGSEDIKTIVSKGWCNWKPSTFWSKDHFYNLVLPQTPQNTV